MSFKHQPFDITDTDITFDSAVCVQFLADNQAKYYLGYLLARNCVFVKDRYFSVEAIGKTEQPTNEISLRAFTYVGRRILTTNISMVMPDTTGVYNKMLDILRTISIK